MSFECSICLENIKENDAAALPCGHIFDRDCAKKWVMQSHNCAVCRKHCHPISIITLFNSSDGKSATQKLLISANEKNKEQAERLRLYTAKIESYAQYSTAANKKLQLQEQQIRESTLKIKEYVHLVEDTTKTIQKQEQHISVYKAKIESYKDLEKSAQNKISQQEALISVHKAKINKYEVEFEGSVIQAITVRDIKIKSVLQMYNDLLAKHKETTDRCTVLEKEMQLPKAGNSKEQELQNEIDEKNIKMDQLMKEKVLLQEENTLNVKKIKNLERKNTALRSKNKDLASSHEESSIGSDNAISPMVFDKVIEATKFRIAFVEAQRDKARKDNNILSAQLAQAKNVCDNLDQKIDSLMDEKEGAKMQHEKKIQLIMKENAKSSEQKEKYIQVLKLKLSNLKSNKSELKNTDEAIDMGDEKIANLEKELALVKTQRNRLIRESNKFKAKSTVLEKKNEDMKNKLTATQQITT